MFVFEAQVQRARTLCRSRDQKGKTKQKPYNYFRVVSCPARLVAENP